MWPRKNQDEQRDPSKVIGTVPITRANKHETIPALLDRVEMLDDPWAAGYARGYLKGLWRAGPLDDDEYWAYETEAAVRIGVGWRWLDEMKAALEGRRD